MADNFYPVDKSKPLANELINLLNRIGSDFASLKVMRLAMIQQQDGDGSQDAHYVTVVSNFGYPTTAEAHASFAEVDSFIGTAGASLEQCCSRHKQ